MIPSTKPKQRWFVDQLIVYLQYSPAPNIGKVIQALQALRSELRNRPPIARGQVTAAPVNSFMKAWVLNLHQANPYWNYEQIAQMTGLDNIGRISEILAGKRI
jgi:hypothetical protein